MVCKMEDFNPQFSTNQPNNNCTDAITSNLLIDCFTDDNAYFPIVAKTIPSSISQMWNTELDLSLSLHMHENDTRRVPHMEQNRHTVAEQLRSIPVFVRARFALSSVFCFLFCWLVFALTLWVFIIDIHLVSFVSL